MTAKQPEPTDQELWQSLAASRGSRVRLRRASCRSGRLAGRPVAEAEAAKVDRALAGNPELRRAALELSEILGQPLPTAPQRLIVRAQALVGFEAERRVTRGFGGILASCFHRLGPGDAAWRDGLDGDRSGVSGFMVVAVWATLTPTKQGQSRAARQHGHRCPTS